MSLQDILNRRRTIRHFDPVKPLDMTHARHCLELTALALTSSNMQLWECHHITRPKTLKKLTHALSDRQTTKTAQQMVVFVTHRDRHRAHTKAVKVLEMESTMQNSPKEKQTKRIKKRQIYHDFVVPLFYTHFFWLPELLCKLLAQIIRSFHPTVKQVAEGDMCTTVHKGCALVVQTFMLAMSEGGYDTCPVEEFGSWLVRKTLGLPYRAETSMVVIYDVRLPDGVQSE